MDAERRFEGQSVAILGCSTGLGHGMAVRFAREGARLALADVNEERLEQLAEEVRALGAETMTLRVDVSKADDVNRFAARAIETYGAVDILCSNAGVAEMAAPAWEKAENDWKWVLGVNLFGLVHAVNAFVPAMIARGAGHVVATISNSALVAPAQMAVYSASKNACLAYCETLKHDLEIAGSPVIVSAVCPGKMKSEMPENKRLRPASLPGRQPTDEEVAKMKAFLADGGLTPDEAAERVLDGIAARKFFILTHPYDADATMTWAKNLVEGNLAALDTSATRFRGL